MIVAKSTSKRSAFSEKVTKVDLREKQRTLARTVQGSCVFWLKGG